MDKILNVAWVKLLKNLKDKKGLVFLIAFPLVFTLIFGKAFGSSTSGVPVTLADLDKSAFSKSIVSQLKENKSLNVTVIGEKEALAEVKDKNSEMAIIIPKEFGQNIKENKKIELKTVSLPNSNSAYSIREILNGAVSRVESNAAAANETISVLAEQNKVTAGSSDDLWNTAYQEAEKKWYPEPPMSVKYNEMSGKGVIRKDYNNMAFYSLGMAVAFVMFTTMFGAGAILEERDSGTWGRLLSTPTKPWQILTGHLVFTFLLGWFQTAILILAGKFLFGVNWGSNIPGLLILMSVYIMTLVAFGLMLSGFVKTHAQLQAVTPIFMTSFAMIGGCYWPLDMVPKGMQAAAKFVPTGQVMQGLLDMVARGKDLADIQQPIYILLVMAAVFFAIGLKRVRFE